VEIVGPVLSVELLDGDPESDLTAHRNHIALLLAPDTTVVLHLAAPPALDDPRRNTENSWIPALMTVRNYCRGRSWPPERITDRDLTAQQTALLDALHGHTAETVAG
jgi:hypothetical protein